MRYLPYILLLTAEQEEMTNITPVLLRFTGKFFLLFFSIAVVTVLTPKMAAWVDKQREKRKPEPQDPRCKEVRGIYDLPEVQDDAQETQADEKESGM